MSQKAVFLSNYLHAVFSLGHTQVNHNLKNFRIEDPVLTLERVSHLIMYR